MDSLVAMLQAQRALQIESFGSDPCALEGEARTEFIRWNQQALTAELFEMLDETGWKPWATSRHVHADLAFKEMIDGWHFFMNILLAIHGPQIIQLGDSWAEELAVLFNQRYFEKKEINAQRQIDGYDGVTGKCEKCKRDLATVKLTWYRFREDGSKIMCCPCGQEVPT